MFGCVHDPGMALFLANTATEMEAGAGPLEWTAFGATLLLAILALALPA
ncbi:MAG: hypothetical protein RL216_2158 [Pseudomonadota bacterium]|jgi:hypothetical protein